MRRLPESFVGARAGAVPADSREQARPPAAEKPVVVQQEWPGRELLNSPMLARVLMAAWSGEAGICVPACPGSGKSRLIALLAGALAHRVGLRVLVAAQTREQASELGRRITAVSDRAALIVKSGGQRAGRAVEGVRTVAGHQVRWDRSTGGQILIGTTARLLYVDPALVGGDILLVDEAWQATYSDVGALGALARQVVCVGDPGQVDPVVTGSTARWDGQLSGPHQPAPAALLAAHGEAISVHRLTNSWRLGPQTCALVSEHFYPQMPFTSRRPDESVVASDGTVLPELECRRVNTRHGPTDPALLAALVDRVRELLTFDYRCDGGRVALSEGDIAVAVPHVAQAGAVRALLSDLPEVLVGTVNALQGMERPAVVALHPMAGYRSAEPFALDAGRMCVTMTRHRAHLTLCVDSATEAVLARAGDDSEVVAARGLLTAL
ncbi:AAA family ATPase [Mycobacterium sp. NPDC003323]